MPLSAAERTRRRYRPPDIRDIRVLFIGEAPPAGGTFFYCGNSRLHDATQQAFEKSIPAIRLVTDFRDAFMQVGCYLDDLSLKPVDDLPPSERRQACKAGVNPLTTRIRPFRPRVAVVLGYGVSKHVTKALVNAGHGDIERECLPFPTSRPRATDGVPYRDVYIQALAALIRSWRRRRVLLPLHPER
jgi:hypothetical protein